MGKERPSSRARRVLSLSAEVAAQNLKLKIPKALGASDFDKVSVEVLSWVHRAQNASGNGGISARYNLRSGAWQAPYPETSGYLIPTLMRWSEEVSSKETSEVASRVGAFLLDLQEEDGSVNCRRSGSEGSQGPALKIAFDLGAILSGFCELGRKDLKFLVGAERLANYLKSNQAADGSWPNHSYFPYFGAHNSLTGLSLLRAGRLLGRRDLERCGVKTLESLSGHFKPNGFITGTSFTENSEDSSFIHPFCYAVEGFQSAEDFGHDFRNVYHAALWAIPQLMRQSALLPSHFNKDLKKKSRFSALTGTAQAALVLLRSDESELVGKGHQLFENLASTVDLYSNNDGVRGGIQSSWPIAGGYGRFTFNNWGAKYFLDCALQLKSNVRP